MEKYFGIVQADSMFGKLLDGLPNEWECNLTSKNISAEAVKAMAENGEITPCLDPSHTAIIAALRQRYGINVEIPETPPRVAVGNGDAEIFMVVRGLPQLTDRHEYTEEEVSAATFQFYMYTAKIKEYRYCLFAGRHNPFPGDPPAIFPEDIDPMDFDALHKAAQAAIPENCTEITVYVTGLTPAMLAVVEVCFQRGITLEALHYNRDTYSYQAQYPVAFTKCGFCGKQMPRNASYCPHCGGR